MTPRTAGYLVEATQHAQAIPLCMTEKAKLERKQAVLAALRNMFPKVKK